MTKVSLPLNTRDLIQLLQSTSTPGEAKESAFGAIYHKYSDDLLRFCRSKLRGDEMEARGLVLDIWLVVVEKIKDFRWIEHSKSEDCFKSWLFTIASNKLKEFYREDHLTDISIDDLSMRHIIDKLVHYDSHDKPYVDLELAEEIKNAANKKLERAINQLTEVERKIIRLTYYADRTAKQIGDLLGMQAGAVRTQRSRSIKKLARIFALDE